MAKILLEMKNITKTFPGVKALDNVNPVSYTHLIEVGMIAVLLFAMNMLFYVRINNSMQKMDNV